MHDRPRPVHPAVHWLLYLWTLPNTLLGLVIAVLNGLTGGRARLVTGVVEIHGPLMRAIFAPRVPIIGGAMALTLGHVVLGYNAEALDLSRSHERIHVAQYERWGPFFLPAYGLASIIAWCRGNDPYRDNRFEREAYALE